jgi:hypothetical protein
MYKICLYIHNFKKLENLSLCMSWTGMFNFRKCAEDNENKIRHYSSVISASLSTSNALSWKLYVFP